MPNFWQLPDPSFDNQDPSLVSPPPLNFWETAPEPPPLTPTEPSPPIQGPPAPADLAAPPLAPPSGVGPYAVPGGTGPAYPGPAPIEPPDYPGPIINRREPTPLPAPRPIEFPTEGVSGEIPGITVPFPEALQAAEDNLRNTRISQPLVRAWAAVDRATSSAIDSSIESEVTTALNSIQEQQQKALDAAEADLKQKLATILSRYPASKHANILSLLAPQYDASLQQTALELALWSAGLQTSLSAHAEEVRRQLQAQAGANSAQAMADYIRRAFHPVITNPQQVPTAQPLTPLEELQGGPNPQRQYPSIQGRRLESLGNAPEQFNQPSIPAIPLQALEAANQAVANFIFDTTDRAFTHSPGAAERAWTNFQQTAAGLATIAAHLSPLIGPQAQDNPTGSPPALISLIKDIDKVNRQILGEIRAGTIKPGQGPDNDRDIFLEYLRRVGQVGYRDHSIPFITGLAAEAVNPLNYVPVEAGLGLTYKGVSALTRGAINRTSVALRDIDMAFRAGHLNLAPALALAAARGEANRLPYSILKHFDTSMMASESLGRRLGSFRNEVFDSVKDGRLIVEDGKFKLRSPDGTITTPAPFDKILNEHHITIDDLNRAFEVGDLVPIAPRPSSLRQSSEVSALTDQALQREVLDNLTHAVMTGQRAADGFRVLPVDQIPFRSTVVDLHPRLLDPEDIKVFRTDAEYQAWRQADPRPLPIRLAEERYQGFYIPYSDEGSGFFQLMDLNKVERKPPREVTGELYQTFQRQGAIIRGEVPPAATQPADIIRPVKTAEGKDGRLLYLIPESADPDQAALQLARNLADLNGQPWDTLTEIQQQNLLGIVREKTQFYRATTDLKAYNQAVKEAKAAAKAAADAAKNAPAGSETANVAAAAKAKVEEILAKARSAHRTRTNPVEPRNEPIAPVVDETANAVAPGELFPPGQIPPPPELPKNLTIQVLSFENHPIVFESSFDRAVYMASDGIIATKHSAAAEEFLNKGAPNGEFLPDVSLSEFHDAVYENLTALAQGLPPATPIKVPGTGLWEAYIRNPKLTTEEFNQLTERVATRHTPTEPITPAAGSGGGGGSTGTAGPNATVTYDSVAIDKRTNIKGVVSPLNGDEIAMVQNGFGGNPDEWVALIGRDEIRDPTAPRKITDNRHLVKWEDLIPENRGGSTGDTEAAAVTKPAVSLDDTLTRLEPDGEGKFPSQKVFDTEMKKLEAAGLDVTDVREAYSEFKSLTREKGTSAEDWLDERMTQWEGVSRALEDLDWPEEVIAQTTPVETTTTKPPRGKRQPEPLTHTPPATIKTIGPDGLPEDTPIAEASKYIEALALAAQENGWSKELAKLRTDPARNSYQNLYDTLWNTNNTGWAQVKKSKASSSTPAERAAQARNTVEQNTQDKLKAAKDKANSAGSTPAAGAGGASGGGGRPGRGRTAQGGDGGAGRDGRLPPSPTDPSGANFIDPETGQPYSRPGGIDPNTGQPYASPDYIRIQGERGAFNEPPPPPPPPPYTPTEHPTPHQEPSTPGAGQYRDPETGQLYTNPDTVDLETGQRYTPRPASRTSNLNPAIKGDAELINWSRTADIPDIAHLMRDPERLFTGDFSFGPPERVIEDFEYLLKGKSADEILTGLSAMNRHYPRLPLGINKPLDAIAETLTHRSGLTGTRKAAADLFDTVKTTIAHHSSNEAVIQNWYNRDLDKAEMALKHFNINGMGQVLNPEVRLRPGKVAPVDAAGHPRLPYFQELVEYFDRYDMPPELSNAIKDLDAERQSVLNFAKRHGVNTAEVASPEGYYWHRIIKGKKVTDPNGVETVVDVINDATARGGKGKEVVIDLEQLRRPVSSRAPRRPSSYTYEKARSFDTFEQGLAEGWLYDPDPAHTFAMRRQEQLRAVNNRFLADKVESLGRWENSWHPGTHVEGTTVYHAFEFDRLNPIAATEGKSFYLPSDLAFELEKHLGRIDPGNKATKAATAALDAAASYNSLLAPILLTGDLSALGIQGAPSMFAHPKAWQEAFSIALSAMKDPENYYRYMEAHKALVDKAIPYNFLVTNMHLPSELAVTGMAGYAKIRSAAGKVPGVGLLTGGMAKADLHFSTFGNVLRTELLKTLTDGGKFIDLNAGNPEKVIEMINSINSLAGGFSGKVSTLERGLGLAPRFLRSQINLHWNAAAKYSLDDARRAALSASNPLEAGGRGLYTALFTGPGGASRAALLKYLSGAALATYAINTARGYDTEFDFTKPGAWELKDVMGTNVSLLGPNIMLYRTLANMVKHTIDGHPELVAEDLVKFGTSKMGQALRDMHDYITGYNVINQPIPRPDPRLWTSPEGVLVNVAKSVGYFSAHHLPLGVGSLYDIAVKAEDGIPTYQLQSQLAAAALNLVGLRANPKRLTEFRDSFLRNIIRDEEAAGKNPFSAERPTTLTWNALDDITKARLTRDHPELADLNKQIATEARDRPQSADQQAANRFYAGVESNKKVAAKEAEPVYKEADTNGVFDRKFRDRRREIMTNERSRNKQLLDTALADGAPITPDTKAAYYAKRDLKPPDEHPADAKLTEFYNIEVPANADGTPNFELWNDMRMEFLNNQTTPEERAYILENLNPFDSKSPGGLRPNFRPFGDNMELNRIEANYRVLVNAISPFLNVQSQVGKEPRFEAFWNEYRVAPPDRQRDLRQTKTWQEFKDVVDKTQAAWVEDPAHPERKDLLRQFYGAEKKVGTEAIRKEHTEPVGQGRAERFHDSIARPLAAASGIGDLYYDQLTTGEKKRVDDIVQAVNALMNPYLTKVGKTIYTMGAVPVRATDKQKREAALEVALMSQALEIIRRTKPELFAPFPTARKVPESVYPTPSRVPATAGTR